MTTSNAEFEIREIRSRVEDLEIYDRKRTSEITEIKTTLAQIDGGRRVMTWIITFASAGIMSVSAYSVNAIIRGEQELRSISERLQNHTHPEVTEIRDTLGSLVVEMREARRSSDRDHEEFRSRISRIEDRRTK